MICQNCKKEQHNEDARFCYFCGRRLIRQDRQIPPAVPPAVQSPIQPEQRRAEQSNVMQAEESRQRQQAAKPAADGANTVVYSRKDIEKAMENKDGAVEDVLADVKIHQEEPVKESPAEEKIIYSRQSGDDRQEDGAAPPQPVSAIEEEGEEKDERKQKIPPKKQDAGDQTLFLYGSKKEKSEKLKDLFENADGSIGPGRDFFLEEADMSMAEMKRKKAEELSRKRGRKKALKLFAMVLVFFVCFSAMSLAFLYNMNNPKKAVAAFSKAVSSADYTYLSDNAVFRGVELSSKNANIFFDYLKGRPDLERLEKELLEKGRSEKYPAISLKSQPLFLFINRYQVEVEGCALFVSNLQEGGEFLIDSLPANGKGENGGLLIEGLMPGVHSYTANGAEEEEGRSELASGSILVADPGKAAHVDVPLPEPPEPVIVTVANCISDAAEIYINGVLAEEKPVNGILTLTDPPAGSEIKIVVQMENYTREAVVSYAGEEQTALSFDNYVGEAPAPEPPPVDPALPDPAVDPKGFAAHLSTNEINTVISDFYTSYLECINSQSIEHMRRSTDFMNRNLVPRMSMSGNVKNHFVFKEAQCVPESFLESVENNMPAVLINARFNYEYRSKDSRGAYTPGESKSSLQLIYVDGKWAVNRMVSVSDEQFAANQFGDYSTAIP